MLSAAKLGVLFDEIFVVRHRPQLLLTPFNTASKTIKGIVMRDEQSYEAQVSSPAGMSRRAILRILPAVVIPSLLPRWSWALSLGDLSDKDTAGGIKQALTQGATKAVELLGKQDGFLGNDKVKIPLPDALEKANKLLKAMGRGADADALVTAMNRAAEAAVPEAKKLLVSAVKNMSVTDAKNIVVGGETSVTEFFRGKTQDQLSKQFLPIVQKYVNKLGLTQQYDKLAGQGVKLGLVKQQDAKVDGYVTRKALDGLYFMIGEEEKNIRQDPVGAAGDLAKKVFGALGK